MSITQTTNVFGMSKNEALEKGSQNRLRFLQVVSKLPQIKSDDKYPHKFVFGYPGIGKSYEITNHLETSGARFLMVTGNVSMFTVDCKSMSFILVSNIQLPTDDEVRVAREKGKGKASLMAHKNAIRSRCMVQDFSLSNAELWGWIADVVLRTDCLEQFEMDEDEKYVILDFLWDNWENLTERSIRLIEKMAIIKKEYPDTFQSVWEIDFLK